MPLDPLPDDEIRDRLAHTLPTWRLEGGHLVRTYRTYSWKGTLMLVNTIGHLAEAAWHHPDLTVTYSAVTVRLTTHDAAGITTRDLELAAKFEDVVTWRPGEDSTLEGTPEGARHGYVRHED
jgi:4a-hydroxytetrahydrobiopterin dehydratase